MFLGYLCFILTSNGLGVPSFCSFLFFPLFLSTLIIAFCYLWLNSVLQSANERTRMQQKGCLDVGCWKASVANTVVGNPVLESLKTNVEPAQEQIQ